MTNVALVQLARGIAIGAHAGQVDKSGQPYIRHPERVASQASTFDQKVLAWLHDVLEDTPVTAGDLAAAGFPESLILQVIALTHLPREPRADYYRRILAWPDAVAVKLLDVEDNSSFARLAALDPDTQARLRFKYAKARRILGRTQP